MFHQTRYSIPPINAICKGCRHSSYRQSRLLHYFSKNKHSEAHPVLKQNLVKYEYCSLDHIPRVVINVSLHYIITKNGAVNKCHSDCAYPRETLSVISMMNPISMCPG